MSNAALVIGVSRYPGLRDDLLGCERDAVEMVRWLVAKDGGKCLPSRVRLLLSRAANEPLVLPERVRAPVDATRANIVKAANEIAALSAERLFVYFTGHGVTGLVNKGREPVLLPSDFSWEDPSPSITLASLAAYFRTTPFPVQFFFVDACRDLPTNERSIKWGEFPLTESSSRPLDVVEQLGIQSTSPGMESFSTQEFRNEGGVFTSVLLPLLRGQGAPMRIDAAALESAKTLRYSVTYQDVLEAVVTQVRARNVPGQSKRQIPTNFGEYSENHEIVGFDVDVTTVEGKSRFRAMTSAEVEIVASAISVVAPPPPQPPTRVLSGLDIGGNAHLKNVAVHRDADEILSDLDVKGDFTLDGAEIAGSKKD